MSIKVEGYKETIAVLKQLTDAMRKNIIRSALRASAKPMLKSARSKVPKRTGQLAKQLKIASYRDRNAPRSEVSVAIKPVFSRHKKSGKANAFYARFIHEGTVDPRKSKKGKLLVFKNREGKMIFTRSVKGIKANPFLTRAFHEQGDHTIRIFSDELGKAVEKYVNKRFKKIK